MIFLTLAATNIFLTVLIKNARKYWIVCIPLFVILTVSFISWRIANNNDYKIQEQKYTADESHTGSGKHSDWQKLSAMRKKFSETNVIFIDLIVGQSGITFILQIIGRKKIKSKFYKTTAWIFGILFFAAMWLKLLIAITPTSGYL